MLSTKEVFPEILVEKHLGFMMYSMLHLGKGWDELGAWNNNNNLDSTKVKRPKWCKGTIKDRQNPRKYEILTDDSDCIIARSRRHIKAYLTKSGKMSKPPKCLIEN